MIFLPFFTFTGCEKKPVGAVEQMHWDRDMCERCKMAISERKFAVQIVDPKSDRHYKFDDIGCAVLWMDEEKVPWKEQAIIWITDAKTGEWIDAKKAKYVEGAITPMAFGFAAYTEKTLPKEAQVHDFFEVSRRIEEIEAKNTQKVRAY
jgi:nitrous oxide reductase accessory protein NosL